MLIFRITSYSRAAAAVLTFPGRLSAIVTPEDTDASRRVLRNRLS